MNTMQSVTGYFHAVYALAALIFGGYAIGIVLAAKRARTRLEAAKRRS
jgi:hypothetical protein